MRPRLCVEDTSSVSPQLIAPATVSSDPSFARPLRPDSLTDGDGGHFTTKASSPKFERPGEFG